MRNYLGYDGKPFEEESFYHMLGEGDAPVYRFEGRSNDCPAGRLDFNTPTGRVFVSASSLKRMREISMLMARAMVHDNVDVGPDVCAEASSQRAREAGHKSVNDWFDSFGETAE